MINGYDQQQLQNWRASMYDYEKQKRTKKPFGKNPQVYEKKIVQSSQIKQKQREFNPILQKYTQQKLQKQAQQIQQRKQSLIQASHMKYIKPTNDYDIVNLHPYNDQSNTSEISHEEWSKKKNVNNPIRNLYNIINGQSLPSGYYRTRRVKLQNDSTSRKIFADKLKNPDFDIVKVQYVENNEQKERRQRWEEERKIEEKMNKSHKYDNILQRYYNPQEEWQYQQEMYKSQLSHGKNYENRLPPSYRTRQPFIPSYTEEEVAKSPALKKIIEKEQNQLRSHQLRYAIEQEYKRRNEQDFEKQERIIKNRVHEGKILQSMAKQYDIINNKLTQMSRSMMYDKKLSGNPYSYDFLKQGDRNSNQHSRSMSVENRDGIEYARGVYQDNWDTRSNAYSERSRSSRNSQSRRYSIKSGGFN